MIQQTSLRISPKATKSKNGKVSISRNENKKTSEALNNLMKFTQKITKAWFSRVRGKFFEEPLNQKNRTNQKNNLQNQDKTQRGWTELKIIKKKKAIEKKITKK